MAKADTMELQDGNNPTIQLSLEVVERLRSALYGFYLYCDTVFALAGEQGLSQQQIETLSGLKDDFFDASTFLLGAVILLSHGRTRHIEVLAERAEASIDAIEVRLMSKDTELAKLLKKGDEI